jgi:hypothetical protein
VFTVELALSSTQPETPFDFSWKVQLHVTVRQAVAMKSSDKNLEVSWTLWWSKFAPLFLSVSAFWIHPHLMPYSESNKKYEDRL